MKILLCSVTTPFNLELTIRLPLKPTFLSSPVLHSIFCPRNSLKLVWRLNHTALCQKRPGRIWVLILNTKSKKFWLNWANKFSLRKASLDGLLNKDRDWLTLPLSMPLSILKVLRSVSSLTHITSSCKNWFNVPTSIKARISSVKRVSTKSTWKPLLKFLLVLLPLKKRTPWTEVSSTL